MLACPYCHRLATIPSDAEFQFIDIGRLTCEHCEREFLIIDNVPVIEDQPTGKKKAPKAAR
jgi:uncharacterized protein YbaR (Trm112 family)